VAAMSVACGRADTQPTEQPVAKGGPPARPNVSPRQATIRVGDTLRFVVIPTAEFPTTEGWRWASISPAVVIDSISGLAHGVAQGVATVTATAASHTDWRGAGSVVVVP
jgi:hypothetical protein